jgi:hypothetical protein
MKKALARRIVMVGMALGVALAGGRARAADPDPAQPAGRFSAEAIDLFQAVTCPQEINGQAMPGHTDRDAVLRAAKSSDPRVADAAKKWLYCFYLLHLNDANIKEIQADIQAAVPQFKALMVKSVVTAVQRSDSGLQSSDITEMAGAISDIVREPQKVQIQQLQVQYEIAQSANAVDDSLRAIAEHAAAARQAASGDLQVQFVTDSKTEPRHFGMLRLTNSLDHPLHHCLIVSRAKMNREALDRLNAQGDGMALLSALLGIAPDVAADSALNGRLRNALFGVDRGASNYVAELPAKGTSYFFIFAPNSTVDYVTSASLSLWSDELQATDIKIGNLSSLQSALRAATMAPRQSRPNAGRSSVGPRLIGTAPRSPGPATAAENRPTERNARSAEDNRTWTVADGDGTLKATFLTRIGDKVKLKKDDGTIITVTLDQLSEEDRQWIKNRAWK